MVPSPFKKKATKAGPTVVVGVSGGIACYKTAELVRLLAKNNFNVHVVMTKAATEFVTPLTFQALSVNPVHTDIFDLTQESEMGHIELADNAKLVVIAPATANLLAKASHGICDDLLTTLICVTRAPILLAPSMNCHMWANKIVQKNVRELKKNGFLFVGPDEGSLACGYEGMGRMAEPEEILKSIQKII
ncbi:MAG TPA: hypothetical protein DDW49_03825 [Deltaproteobacteria bacterium]|nr:hypothetical protein [Deltaproteobacteria bacterium]